MALACQLLSRGEQTMRLFLLLLFCLLSIGCNSDPRCRRETALLRAEILDLEDKYYLLKSENDALTAGQGIATSSYLGSQSYIGGEITQPNEAYYTDTGEPYYPIVSNEAAYDDEITYEHQLNSPTQARQSATASRSGTAIKLAPDNSITPLETETAPSVVQLDDLGDYDSGDYAELLYDPDSAEATDTLENDINVLLDAPDVATNELEIGYNMAKPARQVTEVVVNRSASMGHDADGLPGDEGLDLLIQTRTADGQIELVAGDLTVSVIDPEQTADRQRIGLWKFLSDETKLFFANNELGSYGILLHLPWDQQTPVNKRLIVHVRFLTPDGRELTTSSEIRITPPSADYSPESPSVIGWTKRDSRWNSEPATRLRSPRPQVQLTQPNIRWNSGGSSQTQSESQATRRMTPAIPAKAQIRKPAWRPIR